MDPMNDYYDHIADFFRFYQDIDFRQTVICPYIGKAIAIKNYPTNVEELLKYKDNMKGFNKTAVNVADLLNLNFNVAFGVGKKRSSKFTDFCKHVPSLIGG